MYISLGRWSEEELDRIIRKSAEIKDTGRRIDFLSKQFIEMDYRESTLIGDSITPEVFVVNLEWVDCFTFIDYVEAMRLSGSFSEFMEELKRVRYKNGEIAFENRNHFFTDWQEFNSDFIDDVTEKIGSEKTKKIIKALNRKKDGAHFLSGINPRQREIKYIPSNAVDDIIINRLNTGDYAGIYSTTDGLDVSHTGIVIKDDDSVYLRHASSAKEHGKVIDQDFRTYIADKPGLIVLRPKNLF